MRRSIGIGSMRRSWPRLAGMAPRWAGRLARRELFWLAQRLAETAGFPAGVRCIECEGFWTNGSARLDGRCASCWIRAARRAVLAEERERRRTAVENERLQKDES